MGGKCDYNNSVEKFEQDSQSGPAPDRRINTMANCAIVGINWGDEGKGRMVDYLTDHYDVVVRYQGGGNAGHTVVNEKGKFALHLLPSGIFRDGVVNILGNGVALDCENLLKEMETLRAAGVIITPENLKVSDRASLDLFTDAGAVSDYARAPMQWAVQTKLISGRLDHKQLYLAPQSGGTRAEVATILMRFLIN